MATNPSWNLTNADVVRLRNARDIITSIIPLWSTDIRYAPQLPEVEAIRNGLDWLAQTVQDYIAIQGA